MPKAGALDRPDRVPHAPPPRRGRDQLGAARAALPALPRGVPGVARGQRRRLRLHVALEVRARVLALHRRGVALHVPSLRADAVHVRPRRPAAREARRDPAGRLLRQPQTAGAVRREAWVASAALRQLLDDDALALRDLGAALLVRRGPDPGEAGWHSYLFRLALQVAARNSCARACARVRGRHRVRDRGRGPAPPAGAARRGIAARPNPGPPEAARNGSRSTRGPRDGRPWLRSPRTRRRPAGGRRPQGQRRGPSP